MNWSTIWSLRLRISGLISGRAPANRCITPVLSGVGLVLALSACTGTFESDSDEAANTSRKSQQQTTINVEQRSSGKARESVQNEVGDTAGSGSQMRPAAADMAIAEETTAYTMSTPSFVPENRENYQAIDSNPIKRVGEQPVSTFSVDVDTGSYANVRRFLHNGQLPHPDAVRVEELINYFDYAYETPSSDSTPFSINTLLMPTPWNKNTKLLRIGLRGYDVDPEQLPNSNLVFLIDVSGSMNDTNKLPLLKTSMQLLVNKMRADDQIAVVVYAGDSGIALESTSGNEKRQINRAIKQLRAGGSTNGSAGIDLAYEIAADNYIEDGINRVILATDGDFNVGTVDFSALLGMIEQRRQSGISLTTLGFGMGNFNDHLMEQLADAGNGNYAYIDTLSEANKVLVEEMSSTLHTIASDVKIQIEFNPAVVAEYRLIGYENRQLKREDFNNDKVDAGDLGAGHTVTALYEVALLGSGGERIEPLRYGSDKPILSEQSVNDVAHVRLRYKQPGENKSQRIEQTVLVNDAIENLARTSDDARFTAAVAAFAQILRGGNYLGDFDLAAIRKLAKNSRGSDDFGYRAEFLTLLSLAEALQPVDVSVNEKK